MVLLASALGLDLVIGLSSGRSRSRPVLAGLGLATSTGSAGGAVPAQSGDPVVVVVRADEVTSTEVQGRVEALLGQLEGMPDVADVEDPDVRPTRSCPRDAATPTPARPARDSTNPKGVCPCVRSSPHWRHC
jgi:RND superfamily putative drug exporter